MSCRKGEAERETEVSSLEENDNLYNVINFIDFRRKQERCYSGQYILVPSLRKGLSLAFFPFVYGIMTISGEMRIYLFL